MLKEKTELKMRGSPLAAANEMQYLQRSGFIVQAAVIRRRPFGRRSSLAFGNRHGERLSTIT
jgi:hypothetical protein